MTRSLIRFEQKVDTVDYTPHPNGTGLHIIFTSENKTQNCNI